MTGGKVEVSQADYLPISALQHLVFCERQCALIHVERLWADNRLTIEGSQLHERVDDAATETRRDVRAARGVQLVSHELVLVGRADVVEFHRVPSGGPARGITIPDLGGRWRVVPVEYKRGRPKTDQSDAVQLCAQAMCLEEMLGATIECGFLFYGKRRQRTNVPLDAKLRSVTTGYVRRLHELVGSGKTPRVPKQPKCRRCSMFDVCLPHGTGPSRSASRYLKTAIRTNLEG